MRTLPELLLAATLTLVPAGPAPTPGAAPPKGPNLSAAERSQAQKVLAAIVQQRQTLKAKAGAPKGRRPPGFQAHRCAVLHDPSLTGKERAANGPFRTSCSDWVSRATRELAIKDGEQPCTTAQMGPALVGCTTWIDQWDAARGKWSEVWHKSSL